jgi:hypothetical protein
VYNFYTCENNEMTPEGKASIRAKLQARLTPQRRQQFAKETGWARSLANEVRKKSADEFAGKYVLIIKQMQKQGMGLTRIARILNQHGHSSPRGLRWTDQTVRQVLKRSNKIPPLNPRGISSEVFGRTQTGKSTAVQSRMKIIGWRDRNQ